MTKERTIISAKQANNEFLKLAMTHIILVQSGYFGEPMLDDLQFLGTIHEFVEKNGYKATIAKT